MVAPAEQEVIVADPTERRLPAGRPRVPGVEAAVVKATIHRLIEDGYRGMSLAKVAADAGTTRPTVYLRWPSKQALVVDSVRRTLERQPIELPDAWIEIPAKERLVRALDLLHPDEPERRLLYATLLIESQRLPELRELLREYVLEPTVREIAALLEAMQARGEIRAGVDCGQAAKMLYGMRLVDQFGANDMTPDSNRRGVELLWPSISHPALETTGS